MNRLEQYIGDLNPLVFCTSDNIDGFYNTALSNNTDIIEWKNLMGNSNWDMVRRDAFSQPAQYANTIPPKYKTGKFNGKSAVDLTKSFLVPKVYNNTIDTITEGTNQYTVIRVKQVNDGIKHDWDTGAGNTQFGCTLDYNGIITNQERISRNGIELYSGRLFPSFYENGALNHQISISIMRWKIGDLDISSWFTNDARYKYTNKTVDVPPPRLRYKNAGTFGYGLPMIGGVWNRADNSVNSPYGYGSPVIVDEAMLYYEFILLPRYINGTELKQVQSYLKQKYNI